MVQPASSQQSKREELQQWLRFLQGESYILRERPSLLFQQAANQPDATAPAQIARRGLEAGLETRPWLRWVNKRELVDPCLLVLTGHELRVRACGFSPDDRRVFSWSDDCTLRIWDADSGEELLKADVSSPPWVCGFGHQTFSAWTSDGSYIVFGSSEIYRLDVATGDEWVFEGARAPFALSPDGRLLVAVSGSDDKTLKLWNVETGTELRTLCATDGVSACAWSPDGSEIAWATSHDALNVLHLAREQEVVTLAEESKSETFRLGMSALTYAPDGRRIVLGSDQNIISLLDAETGAVLFSFAPHSDNTGISNYAFSRDGLRVLSASGSPSEIGTDIRIEDAESGVELGTLTGHLLGVVCCAFSSDRRRIVTGSWDKTLRIWDAELAERSAGSTSHRGPVWAGTQAPGRTLMATASLDMTLKEWQPDLQEEVATLAGHQGQVFACSYSPTGDRLASASEDGTIKIWDADSGREVMTCKGHAGGVHAVAYTQDGTRIVSGSSDCTIRVWDALTGNQLLKFGEYVLAVQTCALSPDGRRVVSGSGEGMGHVWDVESGALIQTLQGHSHAALFPTIWDSCFSPDGRSVVTASRDGTLILWPDALEQGPSVLKGHRDDVVTCTYSPDGRWVISGSHDKTVRVWDVGSKTEIFKLAGHSDHVSSCAYFADAQHILSWSSDGTLVVWNVRTGEEVRRFYASAALRTVFHQTVWRVLTVGDVRGRVYVLRLMGLDVGIPIVTGVYLYRFHSRDWDEHPTTTCEWCGERFLLPARTLDAIISIASNSNLASDASPCAVLPDEAWNEQRLLTECTKCRSPLRFNPFVVDDRDRFSR